jgi:hypothetical protein
MLMKTSSSIFNQWHEKHKVELHFMSFLFSGIIWQIALALDSPLVDQKKISQSLVEYMIDGDPESFKLLTRY